jgi:hypothetical protein
VKQIIKISVLIVPVLILVIFLLRGKAPFGSSNTTFAIDAGKEISRIEFSSADRVLTLEKKNENWFVNGTHETRKSSILFILRILNELQIKSPVSPELFNIEIIEKKVIPVRVKVYSERKLLRSFLVYKTDSNPYRNIMKLKEGAKPFITFIPGSEAEIGYAFNMNELFWQPFTLFELMPSEISSVTLENFREPSASFAIRKKGMDLILTDLENDLTGWDTSKVVRYISYFTRIPFESWAMDLPAEGKNEIGSGEPLYRLTVTGTNGLRTVLSLWEREAPAQDGKSVDSDRLWGKTEDRNEIFVIRYIDIDPVLKKRSYFFDD